MDIANYYELLKIQKYHIFDSIENHPFINPLPLDIDKNICLLLYDFIRNTKPDLIVDYGSGLGNIVNILSIACRNNSSGKIVCVETDPQFISKSEIKFLMSTRVKIIDNFNIPDGSCIIINSYYMSNFNELIKFINCNLLIYNCFLDCYKNYQNILNQLNKIVIVDPGMLIYTGIKEL